MSAERNDWSRTIKRSLIIGIPTGWFLGACVVPVLDSELNSNAIHRDEDAFTDNSASCVRLNLNNTQRVEVLQRFSDYESELIMRDSDKPEEIMCIKIAGVGYIKPLTEEEEAEYQATQTATAENGLHINTFGRGYMGPFGENAKE